MHRKHSGWNLCSPTIIAGPLMLSKPEMKNSTDIWDDSHFWSIDELLLFEVKIIYIADTPSRIVVYSRPGKIINLPSQSTNATVPYRIQSIESSQHANLDLKPKWHDHFQGYSSNWHIVAIMLDTMIVMVSVRFSPFHVHLYINTKQKTISIVNINYLWMQAYYICLWSNRISITITTNILLAE